ncbi:uncharacterized protein MONBRDRAFT_11093 [Monosiga brevicollis MX1]|uniref:Peptidase A1 domain-containing protein n=1 Tax=Monosiga brevicollis TaxID=81824 RepID=A9V867_MONBE|nr:uncharacterized protein MONBRDRAFT_11093 [Monosiga brevicollis MX1]EDQ86218.1 predicted protein [Monosiga brevicollis MX1]|eukprot:XP_001748888.1 hypothetical protein [Monosiga brevicollis MX1]
MSTADRSRCCWGSRRAGAGGGRTTWFLVGLVIFASVGVQAMAANTWRLPLNAPSATSLTASDSLARHQRRQMNLHNKSSPITGQPESAYSVEIFLGTPPQQTLGSVDLTGAAGWDLANTSATKNSLVYTPIPADGRTYYSVVVLQMRIGTQVLDIPCSSYNSPYYTIVDSGTTDVIVPKVVHDAIVREIDPILIDRWSLNSQVSRAKFYQGEECYEIANPDLTELPSVYIGLPQESNPDKMFELRISPWHYIRPLVLQGSLCYGFGIVTNDNVVGVTLGMVLLTNYVTIYDQEHSRVGFATSSCSGVRNVSDCLPESKHTRDLQLQFVYIALGVAGALLLILGAVLMIKMRKWSRVEMHTDGSLIPRYEDQRVLISPRFEDDEEAQADVHPRRLPNLPPACDNDDEDEAEDIQDDDDDDHDDHVHQPATYKLCMTGSECLARQIVQVDDEIRTWHQRFKEHDTSVPI